MAPNAPIGAAFIRIATSLKIGSVSACRKSTTGSAFLPTMARARPNRTEMNSTCRISPSANAPTSVVGMMFIRKPVIDCSCAFSA
ncbi:hypothetical protein D3C86_1971720 [compost metagenome]